MKHNIVQEKSFSFAIEINKVYRKLIDEQKEYILSKQLLRSGTSIGANVEEAIGGHSKADFLSKMTIAYKEARETLYWIKLLTATNILKEEKAIDLKLKAEEISRIIGKIQITTKSHNS
jgi:four helix bundle protein